MGYNKMSGLKGLLYGVGAAIASPFLISSCDGKTPTEPEPVISQTAILEDYIDIKYNSTLENISSATLNVSKNGDVILSRNIAQPNYSETFSYSTNLEITRGNYCFTLIAETKKVKEEKTTCVEIPKYAIDINLSDSETGVNEGGELILNLENKLSSKNPEVNPLKIKTITSFEGLLQTSPQEYFIFLTAEDNIQGNQTYTINLNLEGNDNSTHTATLTGTIYDLLDVSGFLEDTETQTRQEGIVKIYDENSSLLEEILVGSSGEFNKRINRRISDLTENILIQGRAINTQTNQPESYIRTLNLPVHSHGDIENKIIRVVPYTGLEEHDITPEDFYRHFAEVLIYDSNKPDPRTDALTWNPMILKWDFGVDPNAPHSFKEIIISKTKSHIDSEDEAFFNQQAAEEEIQNRLFNPDGLGALFCGTLNTNNVRIEEDWQFNQERDYGRIIIYPSRNKVYAALTSFNGYVPFARVLTGVFLDGNIPLNSNNLVHELTHALGLRGHAETLLFQQTHQTILSGSSAPLDVPKFPEIKISNIFCDETVIHGEGTLENKRLGLKDLMWFYWLDEDFSP